jgi:hypothetical protein
LSRGAALVLTDRTAFGPLIDMPLCVGIAENSQEYLAYDGSKYKTYILTPLDIDGLLGFARSVIEGHELSEAESALYQVEE